MFRFFTTRLANWLRLYIARGHQGQAPVAQAQLTPAPVAPARPPRVQTRRLPLHASTPRSVGVDGAAGKASRGAPPMKKCYNLDERATFVNAVNEKIATWCHCHSNVSLDTKRGRESATRMMRRMARDLELLECTDPRKFRKVELAARRLTIDTRAVEALADVRLGVCVACQDRRVGMVFEPCMHACVCVQCAARITVCPMCRAPGAFKRIYL